MSNFILRIVNGTKLRVRRWKRCSFLKSDDFCNALIQLNQSTVHNSHHSINALYTHMMCKLEQLAVDQVNWISKKVVIKQTHLNKARTATLITVMAPE